MAILKKTYPFLFLPLTALALGMTSCYTEFDPKIDSKPVLCMNSTITPGDSITLFLTRTWAWTEGEQKRLDLDVRDAEVRLTVNGEFKETLTPARITINPGYSPGRQEYRECYRSGYLPASGDVIRLEATSIQYGEAAAEITVPYPVPIDRIEPQVLSCISYGDTTGFPAVADTCEFNLRFKLLAYFTDPAESTDYYDLSADYAPFSYLDGEAIALPDYSFIDFSGEPLLTEHVTVLESVKGDPYGYSIFSDRQINGLTYPLRMTVSDYKFFYWNPLDLPGPKKTGITVRLRHINQAYYKHVISIWEANDAIVGTLGGVGLANPVYPLSNVSTGAGVVAAYAEASLTIPIVDIIALAQKGNFQ